MKLKHTAAAVLACWLLAGTASAAPLAAFSATPSNTTVGQANSLNVVFTSSGGFSSLGYLDLTLPSAFTVSNPIGNCALIAVTVDGAPASITECGRGGGGQLFARLNNPIADGATVRVIYSSSLITNPATPGSYPFSFETTSGGFLIGEASATLSIAAPAPIPTMTEWAMILLGVLLAGSATLMIQKRRLAA
ncbi:hypothetical protein D3C71_598920 [compost metagenome]